MWPDSMALNTGSQRVLILVLVDVGLRLMTRVFTGGLNTYWNVRILILVLVDVGLGRNDE